MGTRQLNMKLIGVTGSIASGKTTVSKIFSKMGFPVINCDEVYSCLLKKNKNLKLKLIKKFSKFFKNKKISKHNLYELLLYSDRNLALIEKITHPFILKEVFKRIKKIKRRKYKFCVVDIPLLFEKKLQKKFDYTLVVYCSKKTQLERLKRRKVSKKLLNLLIARQLDIKDKVCLANFVIYNDNVSKIELQNQLFRLKKFLT